MHQNVKLFIGGQELEFAQEPSILYQYSMDDIQNPTAVKNSYTKTIQVEGTPRNNQIFNDIWDLTRTQAADGDIEGYFNPSKRTDFELYIDGDVYETGYVKLDAINRAHNKVVYNITLFGGIGDFLYSLTYSDTGEQLKLRDLNYIVKGDVTGNPQTELDFNITWETVRAAWYRLANPAYFSGEQWDVVNFAPCYNGYPDALDADKVLINTSGFTSDIRVRQGNSTTVVQGFPSAVTESGETYQTVNGYGFGEITGKMSEWEIRDLRSYLQRPVLRVKKVIEAICDPTQNGGYEVVLDPSFFSSGNDYYEKAWITLPLLTDMEYEEETSSPWDVSVSRTTTLNGISNTIYDLREDSARGQGTTALEVTFRPMLNVRDSVYPRDPATANTLYTSAYITGSDSRIDYSSYVYQLVGFDAQGNVVCGSEIYNLTSEVNGAYLNIANTLYQTPYPAVAIQNRLGSFSKVSAGVYEWGEDITLKMNTNNSKVAQVKLYVTMLANITQGYTSRGELYNTYGSRRGMLYTSTTVSQSSYSAATKGASWVVTTFDGVAYYGNGSKINSGAKITKQVLLNVDGTPCDYLLGYLKTFGLYLRKDPIRKKVEILTRANYYNVPTVQDWNDRIDHTRDIKITPLTFKHKWYSFNYSQKDKGAFESKYYTKYGNDYGIQKVNTGYNFDSETEDLLKGIVYNNAAEGIEKSPYFYNRVVGGQGNYPTALFSWMKYTLRKGEDDFSVDVGSSLNFSDVALSEFGEMYDSFPKVQFRDSKKEPIDGSGVFVFYNGTLATSDVNGNPVYYTLSDDLPEMMTYNSNPCWLWSDGEFNKAGQQICGKFGNIPSFGRYKYNDNNAYIINSWDFGKTKELYVPYVYYNENSNIYDRYWSNYVNDLYDVNTRICEANVLLPRTQGERLLRAFYWFENSLWRINKIIDWNVCSEDTTKVEFVKVQDILHYTDIVTPIEPTGETPTTTCVMSPDPIPASGGVVTFTVNSDQGWGGNGPWYDWIEFSDNYWSGHNPSGQTTFTATAQTNTDTASDWRTFTVMLVGDYDDRQMFNFIQLGPEGAFITPSPSSLTFPASGGTQYVTLTYVGYDEGYNWIVDTNEGDDYGWQSVDSITPQGNGVYQVAVSVTANSTGQARNTYFQFEKNGFTCSIGVSQEA